MNSAEDMALSAEEIMSEPQWYHDYTDRLISGKVDMANELRKLSELGVNRLNQRLNGDINDLQYCFLRTLFPDGSEDEEVANILRKKRTEYLKTHPEERIARGASVGIIGFDGRFYTMEQYEGMTDSEKRGVFVGSTCFHYNSETPGMGSKPTDRY